MPDAFLLDLHILRDENEAAGGVTRQRSQEKTPAKVEEKLTAVG